MTSPEQASPEMALVENVLSDIWASPTPYHAVERARELLESVGFTSVDMTKPLSRAPGPYLVTSGGSLVAWIQQEQHQGFTIVGAHTDSPNLRVRTNPDVAAAGFEQVGMEIYGGVLLNSWLDRGLGLGGRVSVAPAGGPEEGREEGKASGAVVEEHLVMDDRPIMIVPQLAIHLDRQIMTDGLKLDPQKHIVPLWALSPDAAQEPDTATGLGPGRGADGVRGHVASLLDVEVERILSWDLMAFDTQPPAILGRDQDLFSTARIDNLLSAFCGVRALVDLVGSVESGRTPVLALYDHEEIGSQSATGAAGVFLASLLERIASAQGADRTGYLESLNRSIVVSADGAHATNPNYVDRHEPSHRIALNNGVVIKRNANQRYATDAASEAFMVDVCANAGVPLQYYIHRNDLPCGSTIGPITAANLGVPTVDIGAPQLAMHSIRETAGVHDVGHLTNALRGAWQHSG